MSCALESLYYPNLPFQSTFPPALPSFPPPFPPPFPPSLYPFLPSFPPLPSQFPPSLASPLAPPSPLPSVAPSPLSSVAPSALVPSQATIPRPPSNIPDQSRYQLSLAPEGRGHILLVQPRATATPEMESILSFLRNNLPYFKEQLMERGALLLRNVGAREAADFAALCNVFGQSRDYKDGLLDNMRIRHFCTQPCNLYRTYGFLFSLSPLSLSLSLSLSFSLLSVSLFQELVLGQKWVVVCTHRPNTHPISTWRSTTR